jgi:signal peptidase II
VNSSEGSFDALRSPAAWARLVLTAIIGLALDQWSKFYSFKLAQERPAGADIWQPIPGWLHIHVTTNRGAVFGLGQGWRIAFIVVSLAAILFVVYLFAASAKQRLYQIVLGMLIAGIIGNLYDRVALGYVRDMIWALPKWGVFPWIFNVADSLLCVGVGIMILYSFFHAPAKTGSEASAQSP